MYRGNNGCLQGGLLERRKGHERKDQAAVKEDERMKEEVTFLLPETTCPECGDKIDIYEAKVIVIVVCPHCQVESAYKEDAKLH